MIIMYSTAKGQCCNCIIADLLLPNMKKCKAVNLKKTYIGRIAPNGGWEGYEIPNEPGTTLPTSWVDGMSTFAIFDGVSSSANNHDFSENKLNLHD